MSGGVTVIGLTPGACVIEDIRINVPYQTAVQIPAHLVQRSRHLGEAIQQQRVMQLGNALPLPAPQAKAPPLAPILRGRGIAPHSPIDTRQADPAHAWEREREGLMRELKASQAHCRQLEGINATLQVALTNMPSQLNQIQQTLSGLSMAQSASPAAPKSTAASPSSGPALDDSTPHFIPATTQEAAEVRISIPETTSDSDLSGARGALRSLRKKPGS